MASAIDPIFPIHGRPATASVRSNFTHARDEISALQAAGPFLPISGGTMAGTLTIRPSVGTSLQIAGALQGIRFAHQADISLIEGVDQTFAATFQPIRLFGSRVELGSNGGLGDQLAIVPLSINIKSPLNFLRTGAPDWNITRADDVSLHFRYGARIVTEYFVSPSNVASIWTYGAFGCYGDRPTYAMVNSGGGAFGMWLESDGLMRFGTVDENGEPLDALMTAGNGIMRTTGRIIVAGDPVEPLEVATMQYVNAAIAALRAELRGR